MSRIYDSQLKRPRTPPKLATGIVVLVSGMLFDSVAFPGLGVPVSSIIAGLVVVYAYAAPQRVRIDRLGALPIWLVLCALAIPVWFVITSILNGDPDLRRILNISLYAAVILVLSGLRLDSRSIRVGLSFAVVLGIIFGVLLLPQSSYVGRMTGPLGDPNSAGFIIAVYGALALPGIRRQKYKVGFLLLSVLGVLLTQSRTSMLALLTMMLWILLNRFLKVWVSVPFVLGAFVWVTSMADSLTGDAFQNRAGSDQLRDRIFQVEIQQVDVRPWIGQGAGSASIKLEGYSFFFHNSYLALRAEAGWIGLGLVMLLFVVIFFSLLRLPRDRRSLTCEASLIGAAICALNLGEVLLALPVAVALGISAHHWLEVRSDLKLLVKRPAAQLGQTSRIEL